MSKVMVIGPFSHLLSAHSNGMYVFDEALKKRINEVLHLLRNAGYEVMSSHIADKFGESPWGDDFVQRDLAWVAACDIVLALMPAGRSGAVVRSDGTMIELGFALANRKPIIFLEDQLEHGRNSFFLRLLGNQYADHRIRWTAAFGDELLRCIAGSAPRSPTALGTYREQRTNVDEVIAALRSETAPHCVRVANLDLTVLPGVLSPRFSHAPDALMARWLIPSGAAVLDLGCGSGVLGLAALKAGASRLVALDVNPQAVATTNLNLASLKLVDRGEARISDVYSALQSEESFDVILFAAPYWDRPAHDDLEKSCFDEKYQFFETVIGQASRWLKIDGTMYVVFSDQGDVGNVMRIIQRSDMLVRDMHLVRPTQSGGHIRIVWELVRGDQDIAV